MGLFSRRITDPIPGTATVAAASAPHSSGSSGHQMCRMNLVISIPGVPAVAVERRELVSPAKWPQPGMVLPIEVSAKNASKMRIRWDEVPSGAERAQAAAARMAAAMNAGPSPASMPPAGMPGAGVPPAGMPGAAAAAPVDAAGLLAAFGAAGGQARTTTAPMTLPGGITIPAGATIVSSINGAPADPAEISAVETMTGLDLNGDGVIGTPPAT